MVHLFYQVMFYAIVIWAGDTPIVGFTRMCVMYAKRTVFDLVLPRLVANDPITADELAMLGEGVEA